MNVLDLVKICNKQLYQDFSIESYAAHDLLQTDRQTVRQTDTFVKTIFSDSGGLKT